MLSLKDVNTRKDFAAFLGIELKFLTYILYRIKVENLYTTFEIPKKNGGTRIIDAPNDTLKKIQKRLMNKLYNYQNKIKKK